MILDTHWESTFEHIITSAERREGKFTSHELPRGMRQIPYDMPGDPELALALQKLAEGRDDTWVLASDDPYLPVFYGTINIWSHLGEGRALGRASRSTSAARPRTSCSSASCSVRRLPRPIGAWWSWRRAE